MDVRLPDGTIVRDVPEGITQSELLARVERMRQAGRQFGEVRAAGAPQPGEVEEQRAFLAEGPSRETRFEASPAEQLVGGAMGNFRTSVNAMADVLNPLNLFRDQPVRERPKFDFSELEFLRGARRPVPTATFPAGEPLPLVGQTPKEFLPEFMGTLAQLHPVGRGTGAFAEVLKTGLKGWLAQLTTDVGVQLSEDDPIDNIIIKSMSEQPERAFEYFAGAAAAKTLGFAGEQFFGRPATESGKAAVRFARQQAQAGTLGRFLRAGEGGGAPRLPVDEITGSKFPELVRVLLLGEHGTTVKARQAARWINEVIEGGAKFKFVRLPSGQKYNQIITREEAKVLAQQVLKEGNIKGQFARQFMDFNQPAEKWFNNLFKPQNYGRMKLLQKLDPDAHALVTARHLSDRIMKFTRPDNEFGRVLNGGELFNWVQDNKKHIANIYGKEALSNLWNFANYAKYLDSQISKAAVKAAQAESVTIGQAFRAAAEAGVGFEIAEPSIAVPIQAYAWGMGHALMDPKGMWFRLFELLPKADVPAQQAIRTGIAVATED